MAAISLPSLIIAFLLAITIHEAAHAWMADRLGDPTARLMGRLTLNPLAHIDLYGTVLFPLMLILLRFPIIFGWAKPVRYDPYNLANPRRDSALISLAGPLSNLALATTAAIVLRIISTPFSPFLFFSGFLSYLILINIALAIFNLLPIHPLDGGKILVGLLPQKEAYEADVFLRRYGIFVLLFLIFPIFGGMSFISLVLWPVISFLAGILIPGSPII
jgi:Zn-dependent protease